MLEFRSQHQLQVEIWYLTTEGHQVYGKKVRKNLAICLSLENFHMLVWVYRVECLYCLTTSDNLASQAYYRMDNPNRSLVDVPHRRDRGTLNREKSEGRSYGPRAGDRSCREAREFERNGPARRTFHGSCSKVRFVLQLVSFQILKAIFVLFFRTMFALLFLLLLLMLMFLHHPLFRSQTNPLVSFHV